MTEQNEICQPFFKPESVIFNRRRWAYNNTSLSPRPVELPIKILSEFPNLSTTRTSTFCDGLLQRVQFRALLPLCRSGFPFIRLAKGTNDFLYRRLLLERLEESCGRLRINPIFGLLAIQAEPPATDESREGTAKDDPVRAYRGADGQVLEGLAGPRCW